MNTELLKLAESIEALAESIANDTTSENETEIGQTKRASFDYGTLGDEYSPSGTDPITRFALGGE